MIVMKFGGTSVATSERILGLVEIVRERVELRPVVVVSTDKEVADGVRRSGAYPIPSASLLARLERA